MKTKSLFFFSFLIFLLHSCQKDDALIQSQPNEEFMAAANNGKPAKSTTVRDIDGNTYKTVKIGNQVWMAENLRVTRYRNGDPIANITDATIWANASNGAWCYYGNNSQMDPIYGKLYNWFAVSDSRGIAPRGWHVPSVGEVQNLISFLGGDDQTGGALKETGFTFWQFPNTGATNVSGFTARPGGHRHYTGQFDGINQEAAFWTSTIYNPSASHYFSLYYTNAATGFSAENMTFGYSIRCIKD